MRRHGNICDTLVFILVAVLLPAWILGHLFLAFFPAPAGAAKTKIASSAIESSRRSNVSLTPAAKKNEATEPESDALTKAQASSGQTNLQGAGNDEWRQEAVSLKNSLADLESRNISLSENANRLESQRSDLAREVDILKNELAKASATSGNQGQQVIGNRLQSMNNDSLQLEEKYQSIVRDNKSLSGKVERLESRNKQLATRKSAVANKEAWQQESEAKVKRLEEQLQQSSIDLARQMQLVRSMQAAQRDDFTDAKSSVAIREKALQSAARQNEVLQARVDELTGDLDSANTSLATRKEEIAYYRKEFQQLQTKYEISLKRLVSSDSSTPRSNLTDNNLATIDQPINQLELNGPTVAQSETGERYRDYVSSQGNRSKLAFVQWVGDDQLVVRSFANKQLYQLPLNRFSQADQEYLLTLKTDEGQ